MRLAAQVKAGYYPASAEAIRHVLKQVRAPKGEPFAILDPCAGEGLAIRTVAETLGCDPKRVHAIELDEARVEAVRKNLPTAKVIGASVFDCRATNNSFGLVYLNPPFDDEGSGYGRTEAEFFRTAIHWLKPGGVMVFVCPADVLQKQSVREQVNAWLENTTVIEFPEGHRPFNEVALLATKRRKPGECWSTAPKAPEDFEYHVPRSESPKSFYRHNLSDKEWADLVAKSPLRSMFAPKAVKEVAKKRPPLALGVGHVGLLLAAGQIDGVVAAPGEVPHIVRGTCRKTKYVKKKTTEELANGGECLTTIEAERFDLVVRTIDACGVIRSYGGIPEQPAKENDDGNGNDG